MSFLKRLSDGIWSYVSPSKSTAAIHHATPRSAPVSKKRARRNRRLSTGGNRRPSGSMSPIERIDIWQTDSPSLGSRKRGQLPTPSTGAESRKRARASREDEPEQESDVDGEWEYQGVYNVEDDENVREEDGAEREEEEGEESTGYDDEDDYDMVVGEEEGSDDAEDGFGSEDEVSEENGSASMVHVKSPRSPITPHKGYVYADEGEDDIDQDVTNIIAEDDWYLSPPRPRVVDITEEHLNRGISTEEMRAQGWCDDHITLVQKIAMRGFEPLMPKEFRDYFNYLPGVLFEEDDEEACIRNVKRTQGARSAAARALQPVMELGGFVRSWARNPADAPRTPGEEILKRMRMYIKRVDKDSGLDTMRTIPLLAFETKPLGTPAATMQESARCRMARLHRKYEHAFEIHKSIECSPSATSASSSLSYPVPQIYALIASHTVAVLVAYRPDAPQQEDQVRTVAFFDFEDYGYDAWNSLALAIVVNHLRDMQLRIAEETGLGAKVPGMEEPVDDPDL